MKYIAWVRKEDGKIVVKPWLVALAVGEMRQVFHLALWKFSGVWASESEARENALDYTTP